MRITITAADAARGQLGIPEIAAAAAPVPTVGGTPTLAFQRADGTDATLADYHGRYTMVHFWASWCGHCSVHLPALRQLQDRFATRGLVTLSLSLDDDPAKWQMAVRRLDLPWQQGRLAAASTASVSSVPAYWLLDAVGKIIATAHDPTDLAPFLADRLK